MPLPLRSQGPWRSSRLFPVHFADKPPKRGGVGFGERAEARAEAGRADRPDLIDRDLSRTAGAVACQSEGAGSRRSTAETGQLSRTLAIEQARSLSSSLMMRTPCVARPDERTWVVGMPMTLPSTVMTRRSSSLMPTMANAWPTLGVTRRLRTPCPPRCLIGYISAAVFLP